jgi:hypothetical protein
MGNDSYNESDERIRLEAVASLLTAVKSGAVTFTADSFIDAVLDVASEPNPLRQFSKWTAMYRGHEMKEYAGATDADVPQDKKALEALTYFSRLANTWLEVLKKGAPEARFALAQELAPLADQMALMPKTKVQRSPRGAIQVQIEYTWIPKNGFASMAAGVLRLLQMVEAGKAQLCRCALPDCRVWFRAYRNEGKQARGMMQNTYCTPEHFRTADRERKRVAAQKRRKELKQEASAPRRSRRAK